MCQWCKHPELHSDVSMHPVLPHLLDVGCDVLLYVVLLHGLGGTVDRVLLHVLGHVCVLDHCFPVSHGWGWWWWWWRLLKKKWARSLRPDRTRNWHRTWWRGWFRPANIKYTQRTGRLATRFPSYAPSHSRNLSPCVSSYNANSTMTWAVHRLAAKLDIGGVKLRRLAKITFR